MKRKIRLTESQFDKLLHYKVLREYGRKGLWKPEWNEEDQILAMYNSLYGIEELGLNKEQTANDIIGTSVASFNQQTSNFDFLSTGKGLDRPHSLQTPVYDKYKDYPKSKFKELALDIIHKRQENPEIAVSKKKLGNEIGSKRDEIGIARQQGLMGKGIDPKKVNKLKLIRSVPLNPPAEDEPKKPSEKNQIRSFLSTIHDRMMNASSKEDFIKLADQLAFAIDYIDNELTDKTSDDIITEIRKIFKFIS